MQLKCGMISVALVSGLLSVGLSPAHSAERDNLLGWGPFRFDMSRAQAKAAVGSKGIINDVGNMNYETTIDGRPFDAGVSFLGAGDRIQWIQLKREGMAYSPKAKCDSEREELGRILAAQYGDPDVRDNEKDESSLGSRSFSSKFLFRDSAEIQLYERWAIDSRAFESCLIAIIYRPGTKRPSEKF
jgi:hypothetical protein